MNAAVKDFLFLVYLGFRGRGDSGEAADFARAVEGLGGCAG